METVVKAMGIWDWLLYLPLIAKAAAVTERARAGQPPVCLQNVLDEIERQAIIRALQWADGNMAKAGRALGMTERVIGLRVGRHGINPRKYLPLPLEHESVSSCGPVGVSLDRSVVVACSGVVVTREGMDDEQIETRTGR